MKGKSLLSMLAAACAFTASAAADAPAPVADIADLTSRLAAEGCRAGEIRFTVGMPQLSDDVVYDITYRQTATPADSLSPCSYLIEWSIDNPGGEGATAGFSAYFSGNHYRFGSQRLQEYHMEWDSVPFMPRRLGGINSDGVQRNAQFVNLLPAVLASDINRMIKDPAYTVSFTPDTLVGGNHLAAVTTVITVGGATAVEGEYLFDRTTGMPLRVHLENSPGTISEQTVDAVYSPAPDACPPATEQELAAIYPEEFGRFRTSNFRIESLPGSRIPAFSLPTTTGERYTHEASDRFATPMLIAIIDPSAGFTADFITALREAIDQLPYEAGLVMAFTGSNADRIEESTGAARPGEHLLMSARGLARDCGAASLPALIIVGTDAIVTDALVGYNNNLRQDVIQKMLLINP